MAASDSIVAIDVGASSLKLGEFVISKGSALEMTRFGFAEYASGAQDEFSYEGAQSALESLKLSSGVTAKVAHISISVQMAFTKFVKLPPVSGDDDKLRQVIEFEAKQNVPFDLNEVIWDYQVIGDTAEELNVMFVAVKKDIANDICHVVENCGFKVGIVEIATSACYNAAQVNKIGREECAMVLSLGARSANLIFCDGDRFFPRNIPIAGVAISQQIAKEFGVGVDEAEELKRRHGFVALGGAYEEPESEVAATISKIVRNVMTRLHSEINRSINIYKSQQKGNKPTTLYICGGSSTMLFTETFFEEKLKCNVQYMNPFQSSIRLADSIDRTELAEKAHLFTEVVGLALRVADCPIEVNLVPDRLKKAAEKKEKMPWLVMAAVFLLLIPVVLVAASLREQGWYEKQMKNTKKDIDITRDKKKAINKNKAAVAEIQKKIEVMRELAESRTRWPKVLNEVRANNPKNVWIKSLQPQLGDLKADEDAIKKAASSEKASKRLTRRARWAGQKKKLEESASKQAVAAKDIGSIKIEAFYLKLKVDDEVEPPDLFIDNYATSDTFFSRSSGKTRVSTKFSRKFDNFGKFEAQLALLKSIQTEGQKKK